MANACMHKGFFFGFFFFFSECIAILTQYSSLFFYSIIPSFSFSFSLSLFLFFLFRSHTLTHTHTLSLSHFLYLSLYLSPLQYGDGPLDPARGEAVRVLWGRRLERVLHAITGVYTVTKVRPKISERTIKVGRSSGR